MLSFKKVALPKEIKIDPRFEKLPLKNLVIFSLVANSIFLLISVLSNFILPPEIPLFFGLPKTAEQLTKSIYIVLPSVAAILLTVVNIFLSISLDSQYLKRVLAFASLLITILNLVATYEIITLVGSI